MNEKLMSCPICCETEKVKIIKNNNDKNLCYIVCNNCGISTPWGTKEDIIELWNTRKHSLNSKTENNLERVSKILGKEELLCQLAEECSELGKAALKLRRVLNGKNKTPIKYSKAKENLAEEIADVVAVLHCLELNINGYDDIIEKKAKRWIDRLTEL